MFPLNFRRKKVLKMNFENNNFCKAFVSLNWSLVIYQTEMRPVTVSRLSLYAHGCGEFYCGADPSPALICKTSAARLVFLDLGTQHL